MGVKVEEQWRYKKIKSERASRSAFAYKINKKSKESDKFSYGYGASKVLSREVIVKITGAAHTKQGMKEAIKYISRDWQEEIIDSQGIKYETKEDMEAVVKILQENVVYTSYLDPAKKVRLTHNIMFSAPRIAEVREEDAIESVKEVLNQKYPDNYFVMAYHSDTKNSHVHVVLNIHKDTGERIDIRKKDLRDIREGFCNNLIKLGYEVKATRKYGIKPEKYEELLSRENRSIYEVVDYGSASYQLDKRNDKNNYLVYQTANKEEVRIWGKEILEEVMRNKVKIGDLVRIKRIGQIEVKVPVYGKDGTTVELWKSIKRNQWSIEKAADNVIKIERKHLQEIILDSSDQAEKHLNQRQRFEQEKKLYLNPSYKAKYVLEEQLQHKKKYSFKF